MKIVADSVSDMSENVAQELDITILPLLLRFGKEIYRDGIYLSSEEFYQNLVTGKTFFIRLSPR